MRVFHPNANSYRDLELQQIYRNHENEKKRLSSRRVLDVEQGTFTPLIFTSTDGMGKEYLQYLIFRNKDIPTILEQQVYNQCILPTVIYGSETCNLTKKQTLKLRTLQRAHERIMINITWRDRKTAQWIREKNKVRDIMETISKLKWNRAGHGARRTDYPHYVLNAPVTHKKPRETKDEMEGRLR